MVGGGFLTVAMGFGVWGGGDHERVGVLGVGGGGGGAPPPLSAILLE